MPILEESQNFTALAGSNLFKEKPSHLIEGSLTPRDAVTSRLRESFDAIFNGGKSKRQSDLKIGIDKLADAKNVQLREKANVMRERELLARKVVLIERLCQHLGHRSVDDGTDNGTRRHSCLCQRSEIV